MRATYITGTITLTDGTESQFSIGGGWMQGGAVTERLSESVAVVEAMVAGLLDADALASDDDECECSESYRHRGEHTPGCPMDDGERGPLPDDDDVPIECGCPVHVAPKCAS